MGFGLWDIQIIWIIIFIYQINANTYQALRNPRNRAQEETFRDDSCLLKSVSKF